MMNNAREQGFTGDFWSQPASGSLGPKAMLHLALWGIVVGIIAGSVISVFRISKGAAYDFVVQMMAPANRTGITVCLFALLVMAACLAVCLLIRNPAIRLGGNAWIFHSIKDGQPHAWKDILAPKFAAIWLTLASGISVGSEGPSIQMGAAAALGLKRFSQNQFMERRFFILAGCAAGLSAAFSAPFAGLCYVYEVMREKMSKPLFAFLIAAGFGVYIACYIIFDLGVLLPLKPLRIPDLRDYLWIAPLIMCGCATGMIYTFLLHFSLKQFGSQKRIPIHWLPIFSFAGAFIVILSFPDISGEGLDIFHPLMRDHTTLAILACYLIGKLIFTAFCYGTYIPAGVMVPLIAVGGVTGAIYYDCLNLLGMLDMACRSTCISVGMASAFAAAEHAPLTALVLVAEMTGSWPIALTLLLASAISLFIARILGSERI